ncbi:MAG: tRNA guanosine(34) transglycosylase Tgt [Thermoanaerobaculia bacterium]
MIRPHQGFRTVATASGSSARAGILGTLHGEVLTPVFMPVGTQATVKAQLPQTLLESGSQVLLANTYHLMLRPGVEVMRRMGGIHRFMSWPRAVLTDSGGYQVYSLPGARTLSEEGATFRSYVDHRSVLLSPESSIETQIAIGGDIMMAFDHCVASTADLATARAAADLTARWAERSLRARGESPQALFGIVQGALFPDLRRESAARLAEMPFDGYAIGGLAVGESREEREDVCAFTAEQMPQDKPRYLMGVGTPLDLLEAVHRGVDMFDCIIPTQVAQRGGAFTARGYLQMRRGAHAMADIALDPDCDCPTCPRHSRAYLHHLIKVREPLGWQLLGQHNLHFYHRLMREMRESILADNFADFYRAKRVALSADDLDNPVSRSRVRKIRSAAASAGLTKGAYAVHLSPAGFASIRHVASGETMHARTPPMDEARSLYVQQSGLRERLRLGDGEDMADAAPLVVWDVGLGAAANAMAAIQCYEEAASSTVVGGVRGLRIVSFESDLDPLRLALRNQRHFPYLRHGGPATLLARGEWTSRSHAGLEWGLLDGDFAETMARAPFAPDLVYYDLFSGSTHPEAWTLANFERLHAACMGKAVELFTYTASTAARVAMLGAGFWVAKGRPTDGRPESTIALTAAAVDPIAGSRHDLLGSEWLERWGRSQARFPSDVLADRQAAVARRILDHPQFR